MGPRFRNGSARGARCAAAGPTDRRSPLVRTGSSVARLDRRWERNRPARLARRHLLRGRKACRDLKEGDIRSLVGGHHAGGRPVLSRWLGGISLGLCFHAALSGRAGVGLSRGSAPRPAITPVLMRGTERSQRWASGSVSPAVLAARRMGPRTETRQRGALLRGRGSHRPPLTLGAPRKLCRAPRPEVERNRPARLARRHLLRGRKACRDLKEGDIRSLAGGRHAGGRPVLSRWLGGISLGLCFHAALSGRARVGAPPRAPRSPTC